MMSCKQCLYADVFEGKFYDGPGRFFGEAAPPIGIAQMNSQFEDLVSEAIWAEAGATDVLL